MRRLAMLVGLTLVIAACEGPTGPPGPAGPPGAQGPVGPQGPPGKDGATVRAIVARSLPGTTSRIRFDEGYPSMPPTEGNRRLLGMLGEISEALGMGPIRPFPPGRRGAADISFVASAIDAGLDGLGPSGDGSHTVRETVNLNSIERAAKRAALLIYRLTRPQPAI